MDGLGKGILTQRSSSKLSPGGIRGTGVRDGAADEKWRWLTTVRLEEWSQIHLINCVKILHTIIYYDFCLHPKAIGIPTLCLSTVQRHPSSTESLPAIHIILSFCYLRLNILLLLHLLGFRYRRSVTSPSVQRGHFQQQQRHPGGILVLSSSSQQPHRVETRSSNRVERRSNPFGHPDDAASLHAILVALG